MAQNSQEILTRLRKHGVDFVIIGDICCVYYGAPIAATLKIEICCRFDEAELRKIESAIGDLHPFHRLTTNKLPFVLTPGLAPRLKNLYLQTDEGTLDCLGEVAGVGTYDAVVKSSELYKLPYGDFRFLSIDGLIAAKKATRLEKNGRLLAAIH